MRKYVIGFAAGLLIGAASSAAAATLAGGGYLHGWTVIKGGDEICYAPYIWSSTREIECD